MAANTMKFALISSLIAFASLCFAAEFQQITCDDKSEAEVRQFVGDMVGVSADEIGGRLIVADMMSERSFTKTWATTLPLNEYQAINFGSRVVKENKHRFSYPEGEASGGYRNTNIPQNEPFRTWETNARQVMQWAYDYMLQLSGQISGFGDLFPEKPTLDRGCNQRFHATHAELKLLTRLLVQGTIAEGQSVIMSVSRHMCEYCTPIVAHLARNGRRRIAVVSPRKKSRGSASSIDQPEYTLFDTDGSSTRYTRRGTSSTSSYSCTKTSFAGQIPAGIDTFHPPQPPQPSARTAQLVRLLNKSDRSSRQLSLDDIDLSNIIEALNRICVDESEGPGTECLTVFGGDFTKSIDCPRPQTITGIYGTFGTHDAANPITVLKSLGSFCDVNTRATEMGSPSTSPFELKCPDDYQLTGFYGNFGELVNKIGIICRRISDGSQWKSSLVGSLSGGISKEVECESGAAGRRIPFWHGAAIDGLGLCCR